MKKITAMLLLVAMLLSFAACAPDNNVDQPEETPVVDEEDYVVPSKDPVADPAEKYTVTDSDSVGIYDETGVYFFTPDTVEDVSYRLIGVDELEETIAELGFTVKDKNENSVRITYRVQKSEMIDADKALVLFGTKELANKESLKISNNITTFRYDEGGEAIVSWHSTDAGRNCSAHFSSCEDNETVFLYANLLYAFVHSDMKPE
ncbi:MAG: hypothetical protein IKL27_05390 [Oscillospiraceae bacterium]|nr:hypothetical protein [Oscillospiraceae bacterium]